MGTTAAAEEILQPTLISNSSMSFSRGEPKGVCRKIWRIAMTVEDLSYPSARGRFALAGFPKALIREFGLRQPISLWPSVNARAQDCPQLSTEQTPRTPVFARTASLMLASRLTQSVPFNRS